MNILRIYDRASTIKSILEHMQDNGQSIKDKQAKDAYYKLGEVIHILHGERRDK